MTDTTAPRTAADLRNPPTDGLTTDAGRSLVAFAYGAFFGLIGTVKDERIGVLLADVRKGVLAIEAEAIEPLLALVRAALLPRSDDADVAIDAALRALDPAIVAAARKPE